MQIIHACNMFMDGRAVLMMSKNLVTFVVIIKFLELVNLVR